MNINKYRFELLNLKFQNNFIFTLGEVMKKILFIGLLFIIYSYYIFGIEFPQRAQNIENFVPENWKILLKEEGDLNGDTLEDVVLLIENTDSDNFFVIESEFMESHILNFNPRIILILFKEENGQYHLISKNEKELVPSENNKDASSLKNSIDDGIFIGNNILKVNFSEFIAAASWHLTNISYTFRYQQNKFQLIEVDYQYYNGYNGEVEERSLNLSTNRMETTSGGNIFFEEEDEPVVTWKDVSPQQIYILDEMGLDSYFGIFDL